MRHLVAGIGLLLCVPLLAWTQAPAEKPDYREFSKLIEQLVVKRLPGEVEDVTHWGTTIPIPPNLRLAGLRSYVKVGDHFEVPHGAWRRMKAKIERPDENLKIRVTEFRQLDDKNFRLALDADAKVFCQGEWQQWQKGLMLINGFAQADADFAIALVCDIGVAFEFKGFTPEIKLDPKVTELHVHVRDLRFRDARGGPVEIEPGPALVEKLKGLLNDGIKLVEPQIKEYANEAIARGLRQSRGDISTAALLKALPPPAPKK